VPLVHAIKRTNGNYGVAKIWQCVKVAVNSHGVQR